MPTRLLVFVATATCITVGCGGGGPKLPEPERQSRTITLGGGIWKRVDVTLDVPTGWSTDVAELGKSGPMVIRDYRRQKHRYELRLSAYGCDADARCDPDRFDTDEATFPLDARDEQATAHPSAGIRTGEYTRDDNEGRPPGIVVEHLVRGPIPFVVACEAIGGHERLAEACTKIAIGALADPVAATTRASEEANVASCPAGTRLELAELAGAQRKVATSGVKAVARAGGKSSRTLQLRFEAPGTALTALDVTFTGKTGEEVLSGTYGPAGAGERGAMIALALDGAPLAFGDNGRLQAVIIARTATRVCGKLVLDASTVKLAATFDAPIVD